ncbi:MAG: isoprenylcysteine carboxylmethyltransferase family protein [Candidatus Methanoperedens sp.]|nr:isoprenylcysteine carboxylmethyltransferase family protein [Candidatus Methanoperedens sp.]
MMLYRTLAVMALAMWPLIPIFFIPLHLKTGFWRKVGLLTYPVLLVPWFITAYLIVPYQSLLLGEMFMVPVFLRMMGWISLIAGLLLHAWTAKLLGLKGLIGYAEIRPAEEYEYKLITSGPFSVVRHPTYLAHTLLLLGVFLLTGYLGTGVLVVLDFLISYFVITRLEERELNQRFGKKYQEYRKEVPRFFPGFRL